MYRIGIGYDVHTLVPGRELWLGGVRIPHNRGLDGHSDADALLHAMCDALLGAAGLRDIGHYFKNTDPQWRGADSKLLLRESYRLVRAQGFKLGNLDATLIAEEPKINPHLDAMKEAIAAALNAVAAAHQDEAITQAHIGIKATTNEGMGFAGRKEGIAAMAVALVTKV
jgi:2-C-methyl-D-erythritol 2,4-cyclodiphosphate synthase